MVLNWLKILLGSNWTQWITFDLRHIKICVLLYHMRTKMINHEVVSFTSPFHPILVLFFAITFDIA